MRVVLAFAVCLLNVCASAQKKEVILPIWTFHQKNVNIYGVSVGLFNFARHSRNTTTNGVRLCLIGEGLGFAFIPGSPVAESDSAYAAMQKDSISEKVNGINFTSTGMITEMDANGISLGLLGMIHRNMNGLSVTGLNFAQKHQGIQIAFWVNQVHKMRGLQIGLINESKETRGLQIGIWNVNEKRKLPLINWNFSKKRP